MEKNIVTSGKTIDLAIEAALQTLGLDRDSVCVQVLQQAKPGFLGFGAQPAKVQDAEEPQKQPLSGIADRPYCKGRAYDPNRYASQSSEE